MSVFLESDGDVVQSVKKIRAILLNGLHSLTVIVLQLLFNVHKHSSECFLCILYQVQFTAINESHMAFVYSPTIIIHLYAVLQYLFINWNVTNLQSLSFGKDCD